MRPAATQSAVAIAAPLAFGLLAVALGQDANWDLRNYHWYNAHAFLQDRMGYDVNPAQIATFHNPLIDLPFYWAVHALPPRAVGFVLGAIQGLNAVLLYLLAWRTLATDTRHRALVAAAIALVGTTGAAMLSETGTVFYDNVVSLAVLGALLLVARRADAPGLRTLVASGLLLGLGCGLKQTLIVYAVGLTLAALALPGTPLQRVRHAFVFGLALTVGVAVTAGPWAWRLWTEFGNPQFPYMNHVFQSPLARATDYRDYKFIQPDAWSALTFPFRFGWNGLLAGEVPFRDFRIAAGLVAAVVLLGVRLAARGRGPAAELYVLLACAAAYVLWLIMFAVYRYAAPLEMLAPLLVAYALQRLPARTVVRHAALALVMIGLVATTRPGSWGRVDWSDDYFGVKLPAVPLPQGTAVLMLGLGPTSFVIPAFPAHVPFWRLHSYFTSPYDPAWGFTPRLRQKVAAHDGPLYALFRDFEEDESQRGLAAYGLALDRAGCRDITSHIETHIHEPLLLCPVHR